MVLDLANLHPHLEEHTMSSTEDQFCEEILHLQRENHQLKKTVERSKIHVEALEIVIDLAEKQFKISIKNVNFIRNNNDEIYLHSRYDAPNSAVQS